MQISTGITNNEKIITNYDSCYKLQQLIVTNYDNYTTDRSPSNGASISHTSPWSQPFPE